MPCGSDFRQLLLALSFENDSLTTENHVYALQAAQACYDEGRNAIVEYFAIANKGLTRELKKVATPFDQ
jgi:hypothetical protein